MQRTTDLDAVVRRSAIPSSRDSATPSSQVPQAMSCQPVMVVARRVKIARPSSGSTDTDAPMQTISREDAGPHRFASLEISSAQAESVDGRSSRNSASSGACGAEGRRRTQSDSKGSPDGSHLSVSNMSDRDRPDSAMSTDSFPVDRAEKFSTLTMWEELETYFPTIPLQDYTRRLRRYKNAFSGTAAVTHVLKFLHARPEEKLRGASREQAAKVIGMLMRKKKLAPALPNTTTFIDSDKQLYYLVGDAVKPPNKLQKKRSSDHFELEKGQESRKKHAGDTSRMITKQMLNKGKKMIGAGRKSSAAKAEKEEKPMPTQPMKQRMAPEPRAFPSPLRAMMGESTDFKWARPRTDPHSKASRGSETERTLDPVKHVELKPEYILRQEVLKTLLRHMGIALQDFLEHASAVQTARKRRVTILDDCSKAQGGLYGEPIETYKDGIPNWLRLVVKHLELHKLQGGAFSSITIFSRSDEKIVFKTREACESAVRKFIIKLPQPLVCNELYGLLRKISILVAMKDESAVACLCLWGCLLPDRSKNLLRFLAPYWYRISHSAEGGIDGFSRKLFPLLVDKSQKETLHECIPAFMMILDAHRNFGVVPEKVYEAYLVKLAQAGSATALPPTKTDKLLSKFLLPIVSRTK